MAFHWINIKNFIYAIIIVIAFSGCFRNYYKASVPPYDSHLQKTSVIDTLKKQDKYFILRNGSHAYYMKDISPSPDNKTMEVMLDTLPSDHIMYLNKDRGGVMMYRKTNNTDLKVLSEVHVYISPDSNITTGKYIFQPGNIQKIQLIQKNKVRSIGSYVFPFALWAGVLVVFTAIAKSSISFGPIL